MTVSAINIPDVVIIETLTLCQENNMPIIVFDINEPENLRRIVLGEQVGTLVE
jgi:uridylate kinase